MSQMGFSQARTGRRGTNSRSGGVQSFNFTEGKQHRLIIPTRLNDDGTPEIVLFGQTVHQLNSQGIINLPRKNGKKYSTYTFRCSHPYSQQSHDDAVKIAERGEICPLCDLGKLQNRRRLKIMEKEYGFEEFKKLPKKDKKAFYEEYPLSVEPSYYTKEVDGEDVNVLNREMYILAIEVEVEEKERRVKNKKTGKTRTIKEIVPVEDDGKVKYKPVLQKVSGKRLEKYKNAVDNALQNDVLDYDYIFPIVENAGTEYEEEVNIAWVDIQLDFPDLGGDRMGSARDVNISVAPTDKSIIVKYDYLKNEIESKMDKIYEEAYNTFNRLYKNLALYKREDVIDMFGEDVRNEFNQLIEEYRTKDDDEFDQKVFDTVLNNSSDEDSEEEDEEKETDKKETTKERKGKSKAKKSTKSKQKEKEEDLDEDLDEDLEFDEDDLFDE